VSDQHRKEEAKHSQALSSLQRQNELLQKKLEVQQTTNQFGNHHP